MPLYYFDTDDGDIALIDDEGSDVANDDAARTVGLASLPEMARERIGASHPRQFRVTVRRADQTVLLTAQLALNVDGDSTRGSKDALTAAHKRWRRSRR